MKNNLLQNIKLTHQLLESEYLTIPTKQVLKARIEKTGDPCFFDSHSFNLLSLICDLLIDQDSDNRLVDVALFIDERLQENDSDGWRYDCMPPDRDMYNLGLKAVDDTSKRTFQKEFILLQKKQQMEILTSIQNGRVDDEIWKSLNPILFFEELLAETTAVFFSHPFVQTSINYVGMADEKGWTKLKLNQTENLEKRMND